MKQIDRKEAARAMRNAYNREYNRERGRKRAQDYWKRKFENLIERLELTGHFDLAAQIKNCTDPEELKELLDQASETLGGLIS